MVLLKKLCSQPENILKTLWWVFSIVVIILTIVILSIYVHKAAKLRTWTNETDVYVKVATVMNATTFQKFLKLLYNNSSNIDNKIDNNNNNTKNDAPTFSIGNRMNDEYEGFDLSKELSSEENLISDDDDKANNNICKNLPPKDDFTKCGHRVAERKCCEYIWAWKYKDDLLERCPSYGVIGGSKAESGDFPHMVALGYTRLQNASIECNEITADTNMREYGFLCGGSLISEQFVLTAAHCTYLGAVHSKCYSPTPSVVGMGGENIAKKMELKKVIKIIVHPKYKSPKTYYDVALLKLITPVIFTYNIHPACLSTRWYSGYTEVNITGWGTSNPRVHNKMTEHLQVGTVKIIDFKECKGKISIVKNRNFKELQNHQLCAGDLYRSVDTCKGDSGGPLQVRIDTEYGKIHRVIGVTSFGKMCAQKIPSVYVRVASVITWIERNVWPELT